MIASNLRNVDEARFLSGWKEIANYLGKGVRTVQRYERYMGFPVRRPAGKPRAAVIATKAELDAWVAASPIRREFQLARPAALVPQPYSVARGLAEMRRRVKEMQGLRAEMRTSLRALTTSIHVLETDAVQRKLDDGRRNAHPRTDRVYGFLAPYSLQSRPS